MFYLKKFDTQTEYETYINSGGEYRPNVSLITENNGVSYNPIHDYSKDYLTFVALEDGTFTLTIGANVTTSMLSSISYSTDGGSTWITTANVDETTVTITTPTISTGDFVLWKGSGTTMSSVISSTTSSSRYALSSIFSSTGNFNACGNIMSLLYGDDFEGQEEFADGSSSNFALLFYGSSDGSVRIKIKSVKNIYFPSTVTSFCYGRMFQYSLVEDAPDVLPATTLAVECYMGMFMRCAELTTVPKLSATTLADYCCWCMFTRCTGLTSIPEGLLPATTLTIKCYESMFDHCTNLTSIPENLLPATALAERCYQMMFASTPITVAPNLPATTLANQCYQKMFIGCTGLVTAPELPATTLVSNCYDQMFSGCTSLNYIKALFTTTPSSTYTGDWVKDVASSGTFIKSSVATWTTTGTSGVPSGWTVETYTPAA